MPWRAARRRKSVMAALLFSLIFASLMLSVVLVNGTIVNNLNSVNTNSLIISTLSVLYKNERQMEFSRLMERLEEKGLRPADAARLLKVSKASVSKILSGEQTPREPTLDSFRRIVDEQCGPNPPPAIEPQRGHQQLAELAEMSPAFHEAALATINKLHEQAISSARLSGDVNKAFAAAGAAKRAAQALGRKPKAGGPSGHKPPPAGDAPPEKK